MAIEDRVKARPRRWRSDAGMDSGRSYPRHGPIGRSIRVEIPFSSKRIVAALGASGYRVDER